MLRGEFKGKNLIKVDVLDEDHMRLEGVEKPATADKERLGTPG
jgi:hypothetical protein